MAFYFGRAYQGLAASPTSPNYMADVRSVAYAFVVLGGIAFVFITAQTALMEAAAEDMTVEMKKCWFQALLRQDMAYFDIQDICGQATMISVNGQKYQKGVGRKLVEAISFITSFIGAVGYAFWASWKITLAALGCTPFLFLSVNFLVRMNSAQAARTSASYVRAGGLVSTAVASIRTILSLNAVDRVIEMFKDATEESCSGSNTHFCLLGLAFAAQNVSFLIAYIIASTFGSYLLYSNIFNTGCDPSATSLENEACQPTSAQVFGALLGVSIAAADLPLVSVAVEAFYGARTACYPAIVAMSRRLDDQTGHSDDAKGEDSCHDLEIGEINPYLMNQALDEELAWLPKYEIDSSSHRGDRPTRVVGTIEFQNVTFSFPARQGTIVLDNFSLCIPAGKTVALVGSSGSGKVRRPELCKIIDRSVGV